MSARGDRDDHDAPRLPALVFFDDSKATADAAVRWAGVALVVTLLVVVLSMLL